MIVTDFHSSLRTIERSIELTKLKLKYDGYFSYEARIEFNQALQEIIQLLKADQEAISAGDSSWDIAYRIVHLNRIQAKFQKIRKKIFEVSEKPYFVTKIQSKVIPALEGRAKELKRVVESKGRLPFSEGFDRAQYFEDIKQMLQLKNIQKIFQVQKEYFHLLGNHFDDNKLKQVDIESNSGSLEIYSLISWEQVLNLFFQEGDESEKRIGLILLTIIKKAIPYSLKTSFAYNLDQIYKPRADHVQEMTYFEDYLKSHKSKKYSALISPRFLKKHQLRSTCALPERVIINEIAWDMVDSISLLKKGESRLFPIGMRGHSIAVQVTCTQDNVIPIQKMYEYKIFNTGYGVSYYHERDQKEKFARPLIYKDLPSSALSYSFFSDLLRISLEKYSITEFYQLHDLVLVKEAGGTKDSLSGALYPIQKYDTCTYSAVEAWIGSYLLSEKQIKHLEITKAKMSIDKQKEVIRVLEENRSKSSKSSWTLAGKRKIRPAYLDLEALVKPKRIRESEILLELGQQYLQKTVKNFTKSNKEAMLL